MKQWSKLAAIALVVSTFAWSAGTAWADIDDSCTLNGVPLHGKVKFVDSFPDFKVKVVSSFPDLKVKHVTSFPDDCGEWQIVDSFPDFTVKFVDSFPDFTIKYVDSFPGVN